MARRILQISLWRDRACQQIKPDLFPITRCRIPWESGKKERKAAGERLESHLAVNAMFIDFYRNMLRKDGIVL